LGIEDGCDARGCVETGGRGKAAVWATTRMGYYRMKLASALPTPESACQTA
jgi:hypothetical protein